MKVFRWTVVLGITGFLSGFIGSMILAPDANQGPLLGILITGPTGALLGSVLGVAAALAKLSPRSEARALAATTTIVALVTLYFCVPSPRLHATVVEGEVRSCVPAESLRAETVDRLNRLAAARPVPEQVAWAKKFDEELTAKPGVVIGVHVYRDAQLYEKQARWNRGRMVARPWRDGEKDERYFASDPGSECADYPLGSRSKFVVSGNIGIWRPYGIAEMLDLKVAAPLPVDYANLVDAREPAR
jgi:uncharacterized membrane protein YeaQ/YmgE (transglycosylase-associated protein family)